MHYTALLFAIFVALITWGTSANSEGDNNGAKPPIPCLYTDGANHIIFRIWIELAENNSLQPQEVIGNFTSWDPQTATIGFMSDLSENIESIPIGIIRLAPKVPSPVAQVTIPNLVLLGIISRSYSANEFQVVESVLELPGCVREYEGKQLTFDGTLTFEGKYVHIEGSVFSVVIPTKSGGFSTENKGG